MNDAGYYRYPTINAETIVFVSEDDLWTVEAAGGIARRLNTGLGRSAHPALSPDGRWLAFTGRNEGHPEAYVMPAAGGQPRRLTYLGADTRVVGWLPGGESVVFATSAGQPFLRMPRLCAIGVEGGDIDTLETGPAMTISFGPSGGRVIGRHTLDIARWKRYRGGLTGELWIDAEGDGQWRRLIEHEGNASNPLWVGDRIFFLSDHEGVGNLFSCTTDGSDLRRHTEHRAYYARHPATDGRRIVYHAGADIYVFDPVSDTARPVAIEYHSGRTERQRKFVDAARYLQSYDIHPKGKALAITTRGKLFTLPNWAGAATQLGKPQGVRYRLATWLHDGKRIAVASDEEGEETLEIRHADGTGEAVRLDGLDIGRPVSMLAAPHDNRLAVANHRYEVILVDVDARTARILDRSAHSRIRGMSWSPDGRWLAYGINDSRQTSVIRIADTSKGESPGAIHAADMSEGESPSTIHTADTSEGESPATIPIAGKSEGESLATIHTVTRPVLRDVAPAFDPEGKYLYYLSYRVLDPVYDNLHFDLGFPKGMRPMLVTLKSDQRSPFEPLVEDEPDSKAEGGDDDADSGDEAGDGATEAGDETAEDSDEAAEVGDAAAEASDDVSEGSEEVTEDGKAEAVDERETEDEAGTAEGPGSVQAATAAGVAASLEANGRNDSPAHKPVEIDFEGILDRTIAFPVSEGRYGQIRGIKGKVLFSSYPVEGSLGGSNRAATIPEAKGTLHCYDLRERKQQELVRGITSFDVSADGTHMVYRAGNRIRVLKAGAKPDDKAKGTTKASGWIDLGRLKVSIEPPAEWQQMVREAWRRQRDQFWTPDMSGVDWDAVYTRYVPLLERVNTRSELSDFLWEVQGELGTSHAYEFGGDYRPEPGYYQGLLGASFEFDHESGGYRVTDIGSGDTSDEDASSPLARAGVDVRVGDVLLAVDGQPVSREVGPGKLLVNRAGDRVELRFAPRQATGRPRSVTVKTLRSESKLWYREWVEQNRDYIHTASGGRVGYIHIPDMSANGYAEFHRSFLVEVDRDGLIVDVRYNGGGHVSQLLLEKLARRRLGYDIQRWGEPVPYPYESVMGPLVALTNEAAGSDGDMFSHAFKMMGLGPLIGKRTWGGVIGINVRDSLVDGSITTQPEFSFWFEDVGYGLENFGTRPDIEIDIPPQGYVTGRDTQLETALAHITRLLEENPPRVPDFGERPSRALPWLE